MLSSDHFYAQGSLHTVCQDYSRAGQYNEECVYGIVSDGCSRSRDTDIGSRLLVLQAEKTLQIGHGFEHVIPSLAYTMQNFGNILPVGIQYSDATLLVLYTDVRKYCVNYHLIGDGLFLARYRHIPERYDVVRRHFPKGAPWYLSYYASPSRFQRLIQETLVIEETVGTLDIVTRSYKEFFTHHDEITTKSVRNQNILTHMQSYGQKSLEVYDLFLVMSDGIESFVDKSNPLGDKVIPYQDILYDFLGFTNFTGEFVARRTRKILKNFSKKSWVHEDDFSLAGIYAPKERDASIEASVEE